MSERTKRRAVGTAVTVWLLGWAPAFYFSQTVQGGPDVMPQLYAIWIILMPSGLVVLAGAVSLLWWFYEWVFDTVWHLPKPKTKESVEENIARLEKELGIHD